MKINNLNSVFLIEFIELFFLNKNSEDLWHFLYHIFSEYEDFTEKTLLLL